MRLASYLLNRLVINSEPSKLLIRIVSNADRRELYITYLVERFLCVFFHLRACVDIMSLWGLSVLYPASLGGVVCSHEISLFIRKYLFEFIIIYFLLHQKISAINFLLSCNNRSHKNT